MFEPANVKHSFALFLIALGAIGIFIAGTCVVVANRGQEPAGWFGGAAVSGLFGVFLLWWGIKMRNRAAPESTAFKEQSENVWTTRSGTAKPSFLEDKEEDEGNDTPRRVRD